MISPAQPLTASSAVSFTDLDDEAVLLNVDTGLYYGLDPVAADLWRLLLTGASQYELCQALVDKYDVESERAALDVAQFVDQLLAEELVRPRQ